MADGPAEDSTRSSSSALERGVDVLLLLAQSVEAQLGVTQIATRLDLSKAVVHRILSALRNKGLVEFDSQTRRYSLGPITMSLGLTYLQKLDVRRVAMTELVSLSRATNETTTLSVRSGASRVYVDQVLPQREVLMSVTLGVAYPLHAGASSKALLAFLPHDEIELFLQSPLTRVTNQTIIDRRKLRRELTQIAERGWATSIGERLPGAGSVAAPIFDYRNYPVAVVSVCGPADRISSNLSIHAEKLTASTSLLSLRMGKV